MKNFIKWLVPWDNEMKMLLKALGFFVILFVFFILTGCETTNWGKAFDHNNPEEIKCYPVDATGCIGWVNNK